MTGNSLGQAENEEDKPVSPGVMAVTSDERPASSHAAVASHIFIDVKLIAVRLRLDGAVTQCSLHR